MFFKANVFILNTDKIDNCDKELTALFYDQIHYDTPILIAIRVVAFEGETWL